MKIFFLKLTSVILILVIIFFGYDLIFKNKQDRIELSQKEINKNLNTIEKVLTGIPNLSVEDIRNGFWYYYIDEKNNESVIFVNSQELAKNNFSDKYLNELKDEISISKIFSKDRLLVVKEEDMSNDLQFHNEIYKSKINGDFLDIKLDLESKINKTKEELIHLAYLYELEGNYEGRDEINKQMCIQYNERCEELVIEIRGQVLDKENNYIQDVVVEIISKEGTYETKTDRYGFYSLILDINELEKIRIKARKRNFADGVISLVVLTDNKKLYLMDDIVLSSAIDIYTIDNINKTVTGNQNYIKNNSFFIKSPQSTYQIPFDSLVYKDGKKFEGRADVYLYEFTRDTVPDTLLEVDTFDQVLGYAGDLMKTFGMPFIQFFDNETDEELHIFSSNPMILTHQIYHMDLLYENYDNLYGPLTEKKMIFLVNKTEELEGYPITRDFLIDFQMLEFPAWWCFDQRKGVWDNIGVKVLNKDGLIEAKFYTIKS
jgi:phage pi2 protein 07